ncbi:beta strand repeat-containing protein [Alicyclobacillus mengziensis]|uniref:Copper amine oxidase-like N-terminal domain-containing protein n=1 Tax=Alicyclobacillus mengziensis TaxID=2931921 RepID=A0A9X7VZF9_9BACL|nr:hypothetical protein [Alicyclobacillus mengziensis]QSO47549.1 hypothetical protein JZ786_00305 [Alicyclobacillus mengziensis]
MKRAITGIAAASMALGMMVPAAFAATTSSNSMKWEQQYISISGQQTGFKGFAANYAGSPTTFMPIWYVDHALQAMGFTVSWTGNDLLINNSNVNYKGTPQPGSGPNGIYLNGVLVQNTTVKKAVDPASKVETTYMPIYFVLKVLQDVGVAQTNDWNGSTLVMTAPTPPSVTTGFSTPMASGEQLGSGTSTSPAVSSNGGALTLTTTLSNSNGAAQANTAVNVTVSGTAGNTPVIEANGSYVTPNYDNNGDWTFTANTNSSGQLAVSVVGTGSYSVTFADANNTSVKTEGYLSFLNSTSGLLTAANGSPDISTVSNGTTGITAVTYTLPLNSSGAVQANTQVSFNVTGNANFVTQSGQTVGQSVYAYSNSQGQATVYVNDFTAQNVTVGAEIASNGTANAGSPDKYTATTTLDYTDPNVSTSQSLNNIAAFAFSDSTSAASTSSPSSVAGVPENGTVTNNVYFVPVGSSSVLTPADGTVTYDLNATNGATIGLYLNNASVKLPSFTSQYLQSSISSDSSMTLQFVPDSTNSYYNVYVNGVELLTKAGGSAVQVSNAEFGANLTAGSNTGSSSTLTVKSGSASAQASYTFSGSTPIYVSNVSPAVSTLGADNTENVTFQVDDSQGNPVKNQQVEIGLDSNLSGNLWVVAVNGTQLTQASGNGGTWYTPIPLNGKGTVTVGQTVYNPSYNTLVPGTATWQSGNNYFTATTDSNGDVTLTIQNGGAFAYVNSGNNASALSAGQTVTAYTYSNNSSSPAIQFVGPSTPLSSVYGGNGTQVLSIDAK